MKSVSIIGILLIVLGIATFAYQGITFTTREKVVDLGPLQMTAEKKRTIPFTPVVGAAALLGGIILIVIAKKRG
ncbi:DUF3185 domain-containing protein [Desulfovibrio psychrotolerans]|uniref:DUF3185 domain-containing protein n=1 Tax=Desulfovibrio psychrotolerans TaxID=415242 RepID=A0A7J0BYF2_9BACT|nr:DUF3185 domain-containing protein [Desulfovibrio psychrotolerans]GFM38225.1 hypothetical protein DSM19430T_29090 [Desulfovibrio psychrotolerans]